MPTGTKPPENPPAEKKNKVKMTSVAGANAAPHVKQFVEVDGERHEVPGEIELTETQVKGLKDAGVRFGEPSDDNEGGEQ